MELRCTAERETHLLSILRRELQLSSTLVRRLKYCGAYTVNGEPAHTDRLVRPGDVVRVCLDEPRPDCPAEDGPLSILYEDEDILLINKPAGMLSQKARDTDLSLVEYLTDYLMENGSVTEGSLRSFKPSVCNRLDRNTSGIVAAGKSLAGSQMLSEVFRDRTVHKYYKCIVYGPVREARTVDGWLLKDPRTNQVKILSRADPEGEAKRIVTRYEPLAVTERLTLLKVTLLTGRSHQIRAHLSSMGHPILGDGKYGGGGSLELERKYRLKGQLLHSYRLEFPALTGRFAHLSGKAFEAPLPETFLRAAEGEGLLLNGNPGGAR